MASMNSAPTFDGTGDVQAFVTKVELIASVKEYTGEKLAAVLASKLNGSALDIYLRMSEEDKKSAEKIKEELLKEFQRGNRDREEALAELSARSRRKGEPAQTFAFKIAELVKLAYPTFSNATREVIAKDYFIKGLHSNMQLAVKSIENFATADIKKARRRGIQTGVSRRNFVFRWKRKT